MRKLLMIGIAFLLVVSIAYAGVSNYYGKIVGTASVQPPIFYADFTNMPTGGKRLNINTLPSLIGEVSISDGNSFVFHTNALGITSFYNASWRFFVKAKVNNPPRNLIVGLWRINPYNGSLISPLCNKTISINSSSYNIYSETCEPGSFILSSSDGLAYVIKGGFPAPFVNYTINVDGITRIEVSPA
jgi:hypothetical protein